jgi:CheY-like chemotaxis protein
VVRVAGPGEGAEPPADPARSPSSRSVSGAAVQRSADGGRRDTPFGAALVLVVDDDPGFRGLAARVLAGWGYAVIEAGTVAEAVERVAARRPDTVLVDIGLPDGDGFGLTQQLVALPSPPRVVMVSTDADAGNRSAAHGVGAVGFLPKDELLGDALRGLIDG